MIIKFSNSLKAAIKRRGLRPFCVTKYELPEIRARACVQAHGEEGEANERGERLPTQYLLWPSDRATAAALIGSLDGVWDFQIPEEVEIGKWPSRYRYVRGFVTWAAA